MKKIFEFDVFVLLVLHTIAPAVIYYLFGFRYEYAPVDEKYVYFAAILIGIILISVLLVVLLFSRNRKEITVEDLYKSQYLQGRAPEYMFMLALIINVLNILKSGGFESILNGNTNGTIISYLKFFLDIRVLYYCVLIKAYREANINKICFVSICYLLITLMYSSRSGILWMILLNVWIICGIRISPKIKKKIKLILFFALISSPLLFMFATNSRSGEKHTVDYIAHKLVARISFDEIAGIELEQFIEERYDKTVFEEKYALLNQGKQIVNAIVPGDIFDSDVQPNQYWRAIFAGWNVELCKVHYMSMTSIFPMYLILKYGYIIGIIVSISSICAMYYCISKMKDPTIKVFLVGIVFYTVFQYFDWCYHFQDMLCFVLTFFSLRKVGKITSTLRFGNIKL